MKPKIKPSIGADTLDALEWLASIHEDTPESQAIEEEEWTKYNLAIALIEAREAAGHTQSTLAAELGVQQSLISKWEKVHHNHTLETLLQLCNATGAKLVMGLEIGGELHAITPAAKRCVLLSETAQQNLEAKAKSVGLTPRETLLAPLVEKEKQPAKRRVPGSQPRLEARGN